MSGGGPISQQSEHVPLGNVLISTILREILSKKEQKWKKCENSKTENKRVCWHEMYLTTLEMYSKEYPSW